MFDHVSVMLLSVFLFLDIKFMLSITTYSFQQSFLLMIFRTSCENNYTYRSMNLQMSIELHRLYSFYNSMWKTLTGKHSASCLARIGFYYSGNQAVIICYKCKCHIDCSELSESLAVKHEQLSPNCLLVLGTATDNILLVHPEEVRKRFSSDASLWDTADNNAVQTVAVSFDSLSVELSLFKNAFTIFVHAYTRSQKQGVFPSVDGAGVNVTQDNRRGPAFSSIDNDITPIDRNNPDFDRLRYDSGFQLHTVILLCFFILFNDWLTCCMNVYISFCLVIFIKYAK